MSHSADCNRKYKYGMNYANIHKFCPDHFSLGGETFVPGETLAQYETVGSGVFAHAAKWYTPPADEPGVIPYESAQLFSDYWLEHGQAHPNEKGTVMTELAEAGVDGDRAYGSFDNEYFNDDYAGGWQGRGGQ